jgi:hypothetical protein
MVRLLSTSFLKRLIIFKQVFSLIENDITLFDSKIQEIFQQCVKDLMSGVIHLKDEKIDTYLSK